ncbi:MAG: 4Fe-4S binding protein [Peptococcaceae bacterium]|nr:4Fe-4S binding protein [Peptococcaceae bacterium]
MGLLTIEESICGRDGTCAKVCPANIIEQKAPDAYPTIIEGSETLCIKCGHCLAVCPSGALKLSFMDPKTAPVVKPGMLPDIQAVQLFFASRRSIRNYTRVPVEKEQLEMLFQVARYAPSGHNGQPLNWLVINDKNEVNRLAGLTIDWMRSMLRKNPSGMQRLVDDWDNGIDRICRGAPQLIIAHSKKAAHLSQTDCTIALTYLELAAHAMGLGACWAGFLNAAANNYPALTEALNLPEGHQCFGAMMIGHPQYRFRRIPLRKKPIVTWR